MQIKGYGKGRITDAKSPVHSDLHTDKTNELHLVTHTHTRVCRICTRTITHTGTRTWEHPFPHIDYIDLEAQNPQRPALFLVSQTQPKG